MSRSVEITDQAVTINGTNTPINDVINAEAAIIQDWIRVAVIMLVALIGPIAVMVIAVQLDGSRLLGNYFGPITLVGSVVCGLIGCAIGAAWKKPWGVVVEREAFGHSTLLRCSNSDEADSIAERIRSIVDARS